MKKSTTLITLLLLCVVSIFAQAPEKFTYQAVVRNASNALVVNTQVGVRVNILQGSATGNAVYSESHMATTNANGLITVNIGGGSVLHGTFADIDWSDGPYFLKTDLDPNGGNDYTITSVQQLLSVPYALYAKDAGNGFSGDYNDLVNVPQIPQIPADISAFNNDAGYITGYTETDPQYNAWDKDYNDLINKPTIPTVPTNVSEFTNDAGYITTQDIPTIPTVPTNVSAFTNDAGYLTTYTETDPQYNAWNKDYNDLINKPVIPVVPTNVSGFNNDAGYITAAQVPAQVNADWNATSGAAQILNKPTLFSGNYNDLTNKPTLFDGNYNSLSNKPNLATVALSGSYNDLINKPAIPTAVGELTNNMGYITLAQVPAQMNADWNATTGAAQILNKPTIPTVPTNVSAFTNDAGYLTNFTEQQVLSISNDTLFLTGGSFVKLPAGFDGDYNSLTNKPVFPTMPTNVSAFSNDAGYLTGYTETDPQFNAWNKDYNDLINKPYIPTVPTNVSAFTNDAGYMTSFTEQQVLSLSNDTLFLTGGSFVKLPAGFDGNYNSLTNKPVIPTVPTNVSAFSNDAGYLIDYTEIDPQFNAWNKDYNDLTNKPVIPTVPTNVSAFTNDAGYITMDSVPAIPTNISAFTNDAGYLTDYTEQQILTISNDTIFLSGGSFVKLPEVTGFSGDYNDLTNKPIIPTNVSAFTNDAGYITEADVQEAANVPTNVSAFTNDAGYITGYVETDPLFNAWNKDYHDLINTPVIPTVPTNVSAFNNDAGYITMDSVPAVPTNVSALSNDAGYLTSFTETDPQFNAWDKDYNDLINTPAIPTVPTNVSAFTNDVGYITMDSIPLVPADLSAFNNDAGFITGYTETDPQFNAWDKNYNDLTNTPTIPTVPTVVSAFANDADYLTEANLTASLNSLISTMNNRFDSLQAVFDSLSSGDNNCCTVLINTIDSLIEVVSHLNYVIDTLTFHCGTSMVTDHEGNTYATVQIGDQCWMRDNLRTTTSPSTGTYLIPSFGTTYTYTGKQAFWYNNDSATYAPKNYGLLYNWNAAVDTFNTAYGETSVNTSSGNAVSVTFSGYRRGICPVGWHLPSDAEWNTMEAMVSGSDWQTSYESSYSYRGNHAGKLADGNDWFSSSTSGAPGDYSNATRNVSGFSAIPVGHRTASSFEAAGYNAYFWSSSLYHQSYAYTRDLHYQNTGVGRHTYNMYWGYSVRCLRD